MCRCNSSETQSESPVKLSSGEVNSMVTSSVTSNVNTCAWIYESHGENKCENQCEKQSQKQSDERVTNRPVLDSQKNGEKTRVKTDDKTKKTERKIPEFFTWPLFFSQRNSHPEFRNSHPESATCLSTCMGQAFISPRRPYVGKTADQPTSQRANWLTCAPANQPAKQPVRLRT